MPLAPILAQGIVAGVARVARVRLLEDRTGELAELAEQLLDWVLCYRCKSAVRLEGLPPAPPARKGMTAMEGIGVIEQGARQDTRMRILQAALELTVREGYEQATLEAIVSRAGVSRRVFGQLFDDAQACLLAAFELLGQQSLTFAVQAGLQADSWPGSVYRAVAALARTPLATKCSRASRSSRSSDSVRRACFRGNG